MAAYPESSSHFRKRKRDSEKLGAYSPVHTNEEVEFIRTSKRHCGEALINHIQRTQTDGKKDPGVILHLLTHATPVQMNMTHFKERIQCDTAGQTRYPAELARDTVCELQTETLRGQIESEHDLVDFIAQSKFPPGFFEELRVRLRNLGEAWPSITLPEEDLIQALDFQRYPAIRGATKVLGKRLPMKQLADALAQIGWDEDVHSLCEGSEKQIAIWSYQIDCRPSYALLALLYSVEADTTLLQHTFTHFSPK